MRRKWRLIQARYAPLAAPFAIAKVRSLRGGGRGRCEPRCDHPGIDHSAGAMLHGGCGQGGGDIRMACRISPLPSSSSSSVEESADSSSEGRVYSTSTPHWSTPPSPAEWDPSSSGRSRPNGASQRLQEPALPLLRRRNRGYGSSPATSKDTARKPSFRLLPRRRAPNTSFPREKKTGGAMGGPMDLISRAHESGT